MQFPVHGVAGRNFWNTLTMRKKKTIKMYINVKPKDPLLHSGSGKMFKNTTRTDITISRFSVRGFPPPRILVPNFRSSDYYTVLGFVFIPAAT